jgi:integrase
MQGANLFAVQTLMGHKLLEMTRRYSHLAPSVLRTAVEAMDKVMNRVPPEGAEEGQEEKVASG